MMILFELHSFSILVHFRKIALIWLNEPKNGAL